MTNTREIKKTIISVVGFVISSTLLYHVYEAYIFKSTFWKLEMGIMFGPECTSLSNALLRLNTDTFQKYRKMTFLVNTWEAKIALLFWEYLKFAYKLNL